MTIGVKYSCNRCGIYRKTVQVPERGSDEDVLTWMSRITLVLVRDHEEFSPRCHPRTFSEVLIPMTGTDRIGGPPLN